MWLLMGVLLAGCASRSADPLRSAGFDRSTFDNSIRAQDDFYAHVNGAWLTRTAIPADRSLQGSFTEATDRVSTVITARSEEARAQIASLGTESALVCLSLSIM